MENLRTNNSRKGIEYSRNLMTIRIVKVLGLERIWNYQKIKYL